MLNHRTKPQKQHTRAQTQNSKQGSSINKQSKTNPIQYRRIRPKTKWNRNRDEFIALKHTLVFDVWNWGPTQDSIHRGDSISTKQRYTDCIRPSKSLYISFISVSFVIMCRFAPKKGVKLNEEWTHYWKSKLKVKVYRGKEKHCQKSAIFCTSIKKNRHREINYCKVYGNLVQKKNQ